MSKYFRFSKQHQKSSARLKIGLDDHY